MHTFSSLWTGGNVHGQEKRELPLTVLYLQENLTEETTFQSSNLQMKPDKSKTGFTIDEQYEWRSCHSYVHRTLCVIV